MMSASIPRLTPRLIEVILQGATERQRLRSTLQPTTMIVVPGAIKAYVPMRGLTTHQLRLNER